jgi:shikimate kinase
VFLIGYRGTGKTTIAPLLAGHVGWSWTDLDDQIEARSGRSIRDLFAVNGEQAFRELEQQAIEDLCMQNRFVVATGGGAVLRAANRKRLRSSGRVVWLKAEPEIICKRLQADPSTLLRRPDLTIGGLPEIRQVLGERTALYQECAHLEVETSHRTPDEIAREIMARLSLSSAKAPLP